MNESIILHIYVFCLTAKEGWTVNPITGVYYQLNTQAVLTWPQAEVSCKQQGASLLSVTDPHEHAYITGKETVTLHSTQWYM